MLKLIFWILLAANGALFAFRMGYLDSAVASKSEPERVTKQLNADKVKLIVASKPAASSASAPVVSAPTPAASAPVQAAGSPAPVSAPPLGKPQKLVACTEVGDFAPSDTKKIEARLAELSLGERQTRRNIQEIATHMVFIPPQGSKEGADKKAGELRNMGVNNFFIIQDNSKMRWGISLGVFKSETAARSHLANLNKQGVRSARVGARSVTNTRVAFVLRDLDENSLKSLGKIMSDFPDQKARECGKS